MKHESKKGRQAAPAEPRKRPRKVFYVISLLIPILFFLCLEAGLRLANYGNDYTQWVNPVKGKYVLNPGIAHKYFHDIQSVPYSNGDVFDVVKQPNAFRIFVLGESSGAGYPFLPTGSFSRYLQQRLALVYPESKIEVVNCSMTAINSYTMRDLFPGILEQHPDLILVYAGHNEYYGALGAGSVESLGSSRVLVNLVIALESYRTFQLVRGAIASVLRLVAGEREAPSGTLMARMAHDQYIGLNSSEYWRGVKQFSGNMGDILAMASKAHVPVILGTLTCNLKDQPPFVSVNEGKMPRADSIFHQAADALARQEVPVADSLYRYAKDLDALRFRAPSDINTSIRRLAGEYGDQVVDIDSAFESASPAHIVGSELMTDHLHPTLRGYQMIGGLYFDAMKQSGHLPQTRPRDLSERAQDSITAANFPFGRLDSLIGKYRIQLLKNDWPYIDKRKKIPDGDLLRPTGPIDSIAFDLVEDRSSWDLAHRKAAQWYAAHGDVPDFVVTMNALINQYPIVTEYYDYAANTLLERGEYDRGYDFLIRRNDIEATAYSTKWLGTVSLHRNQLQPAEKYLKQSLQLDARDPQVWYNLAGVYIGENHYKEALEAVNRAIDLNARYADAIALQNKLKNVLK
ncbi:MAG TPA: tetratricopeptide repeat protein [Bacteroidota bacterium]|nr:tetratricopeptide repeat protein [Bacteroidota bacterium]